MKVVGIGGGHGLAVTLRAVRSYADDVSAVVTVADDGGSSGRLTRELGIPPPGDIRNCLVALSDRDDIGEIFQHRFTGGALTGHTVGNLVIAGLVEVTGDLATAVERAGRMLESHGRVFPATNEIVRLRARTGAGVIKGQVRVARTRSPIQAVYLEPAAPVAYPGAVTAIMEADQVVLGPGSLFTSLIATLLVPGIKEALQQTAAKRVFVCNSRMQKGETEGLDAAAHVDALMAHAGAYCVDSILVQSPILASDGVEVDLDALGFSRVRVETADMAAPDGSHDPGRLGDALRSLT
ncbi:MAG: uridine diphosphate-N-acetylglucosamine-binding protein YvcK [Actinomycetota bacterium]|nr:uridine diphosphate-N-acetylglucosamine-binding protein YvcK [Actinomycetota bacterium]